MFHLSSSLFFDMTIHTCPKVFGSNLCLWKGSGSVSPYVWYVPCALAILFWKSYLPLCCSQSYFLSLFILPASVDYVCVSPVYFTSSLPCLCACVHICVFFVLVFFLFLSAPCFFGCLNPLAILCFMKKNHDKRSLLRPGGAQSVHLQARQPKLWATCFEHMHNWSGAFTDEFSLVLSLPLSAIIIITQYRCVEM